MVDTTTLIVTSTLVQTAVITVTLIVFILQFRSQEKSIKEASYQGLMGRYNDFIGVLVEKPELTQLMMGQMIADPSKGMSREDAEVFAHLMVAYGIIEEAYSLYVKKWIDEDNWLQWSAWLEIMCKHPLFPQMVKATSGTFDPRFEEYVSKSMQKQRSEVKLES